VLGVIGRTLPQLNVLSLGFSLNVIVALAATAVALGGAAWLFQERIESMLGEIVRGLSSSSSVSP
jgi:flagellar biosynthetic protein FliR